VLKDLFYRNGDGWVELPTWARYFLDAGAAAAAAVGSRLVLCLAVPSRSYVAALAACGIVTTRASLPAEQSSPAGHFELICNLPEETPVSLLSGRKKLRGLFIGCDDHQGMKYARIMVNQKSAGGGSYLIPEAGALRIEVLPAGPINLPKKQGGRSIPPVADFVRHILGDRQAQGIARQPRLECLIVGRVNVLRREIMETEFATSNDRTVYHEGRLQDLLQAHRFLNGSEHYRSDICRVNGRAPVFANNGAIPPFVIFDGATGFIRWRDQLRDSNWIVILDKTDARFREAAQVLNQAYLSRIDDNGLVNLPSPPAGVEVMSFYEHTR
jgi:hypothetical protein